MHTLIVESGKHKGKSITLPEKEVVIGREESCFIRMTSADVSRQHCSFIPTDRGLLVRDLSSQNGTFVNGVRIEVDTLLQPGDTVQIGSIKLRLSGPRVATGPGSDTSEEEIFGWLSDTDTSTDILKSSDTTIVKATQPAAPQPEPKPTFESVAEEARDIIRRHREAQQRH